MNTECENLSGSIDIGEYQKMLASVPKAAKECGMIQHEDGLYKMWVDCKVIDKFTKNKLFGGRKYYFVLNIMGTTKEIQVDENNYYNQSEMNRIHMYSEDRKTWFPTRQ